MTIDYERTLLGAALMYPDVVNNVTLDAADFADPRYGTLWQLMTTMGAAGEPVTPTTVLGALSRIPKAERVGIDGAHLTDLYTGAPNTANEGEIAAEHIANDATIRRIATAARRVLQLAEGGGDAAYVHETARAEIDAAHRAVAQVHLVADSIGETLDSLDKESLAIPTPWEDLNSLILGWEPSALYVIGARPGVGKSIIGLQAALTMQEHGYVAFHSLEMSQREINQRLIANLAEVPLGRLKGRSKYAQPLTDRDWQRIAAVLPRINSLRISVDDAGDVSITGIRAHARTLARKGPLAGIIVDYLQLMKAPPGDHRPRHEVVAGFSRELKLLAKELDTPVIALAQLNREVTRRQSGLPTMDDLRESGAIEQDANVIILLHSPEGSPDVDMGVAKNRSGPQGAVRLTKRGEFARVEPRQWTPAHHAYEN